MFAGMLKRLFGSANDRYVKKIYPIVNQINALESNLSALSDQELQARTPWLKERLAQGETLDDILVDAFATVREASKRVLGMRHFDVQMVGGIILHRGMVTEMMTGEGKTLVATLPSYLNALTGKGVHVVTVNDYLARRDSEWMGRLHHFLGLSTGCILNELDDDERRQAYGADITYGTNNEFGFDYLRDNMKFRREDMVQREFHYAIVDEVDSILIDEARTPLIISGPAEDSSDLYKAVNVLIPQLGAGDYEKDEKSHSVTLTEVGSQKIEELLAGSGMLKGGSLYDINNIMLVHHVNQALRAHVSFQRDVDYIVKDNKVIIIDEFTGRMMEGRRYSEGLHQALEAKEGVPIQMENQTLASITFQNYFRMYQKLSGMTGSAMTEAAELGDIYKLEVMQVPTNVPVARIDEDDEVYRTAKEKYAAIIKLIQECREKGQPVLVGTTSIEKSELIHSLLKQAKIPHQVLNARHHEQEADIIAEAGAPGSVTVATNMSGRGTDIKLGGNLDIRIAAALKGIEDPKLRQKTEEAVRQQHAKDEARVKEAGGLYVIGTERHESRRIDNQLRGRAGRQGDPGHSKFFLSLEDDLMRIFGSEKLGDYLQKLGLEEGEAIVHTWINKAIERAQQKVEARNYDIRKHLLKYDDVMNDQRKVVYGQRAELMDTDDASELIAEMRAEVVEDIVAQHIPENSYSDQWQIDSLHAECLRVFNLDLPLQSWSEEEGIADAEIRERIQDQLNRKMEGKERNYGVPMMRVAEKSILLRVLDQVWKEHLLELDHLRQGINLRAYAQRDPLNEYKQEAFLLFRDMLAKVREQTIMALSHLEMREQTADEVLVHAFEGAEIREDLLELHGAGDFVPQVSAASSSRKPAENKKKTISHEAHAVKIGGIVPPSNRNALCPCGSGKRFKHCHGAIN
jgi:preprotein translocase subunit SecA